MSFSIKLFVLIDWLLSFYALKNKKSLSFINFHDFSPHTHAHILQFYEFPLEKVLKPLCFNAHTISKRLPYMQF